MLLVRRRILAIAVPPVIVIPCWLAAAYIATNVRTDCASATGWAVLTGQSTCSAPLAYTLAHPTPWWGFNHVFGPLLLIALVVVPVIATVYIEVRLLRSDRHIAATVSP